MLPLQCDEEENKAEILDAICSSRKRYWELRRQYAPHVLKVVAAATDGESSFTQMDDEQKHMECRLWDGDPLTAEEGTDWHNWHDSMKVAQVLLLEELLVNCWYCCWTVPALDCDDIFRCRLCSEFTK